MVFQARLFGMAVLWGSGLMLAYDCLRMLRMMIRQRKGLSLIHISLVTKDRVLAHNPVGALYQVKAYYKRLLDD